MTYFPAESRGVFEAYLSRFPANKKQSLKVEP